LLVTFGTCDNYRTEYVNFEVAEFETSYHAILGRPSLTKFMVIPNHTYLLLKMPAPKGILLVYGDLQTSYACEAKNIELSDTLEQSRNSVLGAQAAKNVPADQQQIPAKESTSESQLAPAVANKTIVLRDDESHKTAMIGASIDLAQEGALTSFLWVNWDIFAWKPSDMPGVPREEAKHSLDLDMKERPVKQRLRRFAQDRKEAIRVEVTWLLAAGFIREVTHSDWLANPVLVKKKNSEWRICVDYTDLNKHCPKDPFPLPHIDQVIDSTVGCVLLSFLDCYSGYHQTLKESDQEKMSFITPFGAYCYNTMTFGLKNAGATY